MSVVDDVCKQVGIKVTDIDLDDPFIYRQLQDLLLMVHFRSRPTPTLRFAKG